MIQEAGSTTTPKSDPNDDLERVFDKEILTAEARRTRSLFFDFFSVLPAPCNAKPIALGSAEKKTYFLSAHSVSLVPPMAG